MRTLKKTLCMVLALVMMLGLCAFGTSAAFSDADKITYKEAVAVLNGIGVIQGKGNDTFDPNGTLTRAEACTIITKLMGGDGITAKSTFTDMEGHWGDSFVAFCQAKGIVGGYGDGRFGPNDTLTGSQWGRMLLLAAGFDAKTNGFESGNANWEIGVAKTVKDQHLADRITGFNGTQSISRDAACEMAFQGMQKSPNSAAGYECNGLVFSDMLTAVLYRNTLDVPANYPITEAVASDSLMKTNFPSLQKVTNETDTFGRAATKWKFGKDEKVLFEQSAAAAYTVTVNAKNKDALTSDLIAGLNTELKLTGTTKALVAATAMTVSLNKDAITSPSTYTPAISDTIEVFLGSDGKVANIVVTRYTAAKVEDVVALTAAEQALAVNAGATAKVSLSGIAGTTLDRDIPGFAYAKDDVILIAKQSNGTILASQKASTVEGKISRMAGTTYTVNGTAYAASEIAQSGTAVTAPVSAIGFSGTYVLYMAPDGTYFAIAEKAAPETDTSLVYVVNKYSKTEWGSESAYGDAKTHTVNYLQAVDMDGVEHNYVVKVAQKDLAAGLYKVSVAADVDAGADQAKGSDKITRDYATLAPVNAAASSAAATVKDSAETVNNMSVIDTRVPGANVKYYLNSGIKVLYIGAAPTPGTATKLDVTVKTGKQAITGAYTIYGERNGTTGDNYTAKYVIVAAAVDNDTDGKGIIFANETDASTTTVPLYDKDGKYAGAGYVHSVWIDGVKTDITTSGTGADAAITGAFTYKVTEGTGVYTLTSATGKFKSGAVSNNYQGIVDFGSETTVDLTNAILVNATSNEKAPTSVDKLSTTETITVIYAVTNGVPVAVTVYITACSRA